jgi:hypothetical protein
MENSEENTIENKSNEPSSAHIEIEQQQQVHEKKALSEARKKAIEKMKEGKKAYDEKRKQMQQEIDSLRRTVGEIKQERDRTYIQDIEPVYDESGSSEFGEDSGAISTFNFENYMYVPKDVWEEKNSYIQKLKQKIKNHKNEKASVPAVLPFQINAYAKEDESILNDEVITPKPKQPVQSAFTKRVLQKNQMESNFSHSLSKQKQSLRSKILI